MSMNESDDKAVVNTVIPEGRTDLLKLCVAMHSRRGRLSH